MNRTLIFIGLIIGLTACGEGTRRLHPQEVAEYIKVRDNGFFQKAEIGDFVVELMYLPPVIQALRQNEGGANPDTDLDSLTASFSDVINFNMRIKHISDTPFDDLVNDEQGTGLAYMVGGIAHRLLIEYGDSTSNCLFHHFERDFGMSPYGVVNMAFRRPTATDKITFVYNDQLFNMGPVRFNIPLKQLDESFKVIH